MRPIPFRIAIVQTRPTFGESADTVRDALGLAARGLERAGGADLIVLPELFHSGYVFRTRREVAALAEDARHGETVRALRAFAQGSGAEIVAGLCERGRRAFHNSAVLVGAGGTRAVYRKVHLFDEEKRWFEPGRSAWPVLPVGVARIGILVCFDWRFPEAARALALAGADVLAHPSNLVMPYCQEAMRTRALENRVFAATANRVGADVRGNKRLEFTGRSQIVDPHGRVLARLGARGAGCRVREIDLAQARDKTVTRRNDLFADRVPALYGTLASRGSGPRSRRASRG